MMDKLLWESLTNLLSIVMTQTSFIVEAREQGAPGAAEAVGHRIGLFREIASELNRCADEFEAGTVRGPSENMDDLYADFSQFLKDVGEDS